MTLFRAFLTYISPFQSYGGAKKLERAILYWLLVLAVKKVLIVPIFLNLRRFWNETRYDEKAEINDLLTIWRFYFVLLWRISPFQSYGGLQKFQSERSIFFWVLVVIGKWLASDVISFEICVGATNVFRQGGVTAFQSVSVVLPTWIRDNTKSLNHLCPRLYKNKKMCNFCDFFFIFLIEKYYWSVMR